MSTRGRGSRFFRNRLGIVLLSVWLFLEGLLPLLNVRFTGSGTVLALLAIAAGILLLLGYQGGCHGVALRRAGR